ncbi:MAG TPA: hypothetical protein VEQ59_04375 [Polyangiaceae bacterium]|nr:hypothetical protein [Polyangiaceae bacterium]
MDFKARSLILVTLAQAALSASCRSQPPALCHDCATGGVGGEPTMPEQGVTPAAPVGGAPAADASQDVGTTSRAASDGGAAGEPATAPPQCTSDDDCTDGDDCNNGAESCLDGRCETGRPISCPGISECFEAEGGAACRYAPSERFVVYTGKEFGDPWDNAVAMSISRLERPVRLNFSEGVMDEEFNMIVEYRWSPNGRRLIFAAQCTDYENDVWDQKFFWLDVAEALQAKPRRIPNLRIDDNGTFDFLGWSATSNAIVIGRDDERYGVRFTATGAETSLLPTGGRVVLCGDDETAAFATETETRLATVWGPSSGETVLPAKLLSSSPDGQWLLLSDEQHAYLARCNSDSRLEALGGPAVTSSWSSSSEYVAYSDAESSSFGDATPKALSAFRVESSIAHAPLFEAEAADPSVSFEPQSSRFFFIEQATDDAQALQVVDLAGLSSRAGLPLPPGFGMLSARAWWLGTTGRVGYLTSQGDEPGLYSVEATENAAPRLLARSGSFSDFRFSDDGTRAIWLEANGDGFDALNQVYSLDLTRADSAARALFAEPLRGMFSFADARIIARFSQDPSFRLDLFAVPSDFEGEPVPVNAGNVTAGPYLQPRP